MSSPIGTLSTVLVFVLLLSTASSLTLQTYSDSSCTQSLSYTYINSSIVTNNTKTCFPTGAVAQGAVLAYYVYCRNQTSNTNQVGVEVIATTNTTNCDFKNPFTAVQWDVTSLEYNSTGQTTPITQGVCSPLQAATGGLVNQWLANQTVYGVIKCFATADQPVGPLSSSTGPAGPSSSSTGLSISGWLLRGWCVAMMICALTIVL